MLLRVPTVAFAMLFTLFLRRSAHLSVRAFQTAAVRRAAAGFTVGQPQLRTLTSSHATVEDLDSALDDLLGSSSTSTSTVPARSRRIAAEIEDFEEGEEKQDFDDPNFLKTTNPRWIKAGLDQRVVDVLSNKGITQFTNVQGQVFDPIVAGRDLIGRSRTGTGKTLAFGLPAITRLLPLMEASGKRQNGRMSRGRLPSMLVLCPTRELARQVKDELELVSKPLGLFVDVFHGGVSYDPQARALQQGLDICVGTPGRIMDHLNRGNLDLRELEIVVLDEADEMLNMGFAEDVEVVLEGAGSVLDHKTQCLLFSATTPPWVKEIGKQYQDNVLAIDSTGDGGGARVATTVRHLAVQLPPGADAKKSILEDIIAVEISKDAVYDDGSAIDGDDNPLAAAAAAKKKKSNNAMQQKIFGKTIVFTETKRMADELVSGGVFKSLTAQALHGDVGQKQRDSILNSFRSGGFNVLVATDVAARGIDIKDVDLVVQIDPPRDVDTYVHRSGRTGRAGSKGVSVLLFNHHQSRDIVRIERSLAHGFKFDLVGPPSTEATLSAAAKTSAIACRGVPAETAEYFKESAATLLQEGSDPVDVVARCLAAISRRAAEVQSRSLITGEVGQATIKMVNEQGRSVAPNEVLFTVSKLSRMSQRDEDLAFDSDVGKIQIQQTAEGPAAIFDMDFNDAKKLLEFSESVDAGGASFTLLKELEVERGSNFGRMDNNRGRFDGRGGGRSSYGGGGGRGGRGRPSYSGGRGGGGRPSYGGRGGGRSYGENSNYGGRGNYGGTYGGNKGSYSRGGPSSPGNRRSYGSSSGYQEGRNDNGRREGFRGRYDSTRNNGDDGW